MRTRKKMNKKSHNIFVVGKAGVGKTSLIEYLYGANRSCSKSNIFFSELFTLNHSIPTKVFDIQSIIIGNDVNWLNDFYNLIETKSIENSNYDWLTTILYVISASGGRIENFELEIINRFLQKNIKIVIALSKADIADKRDVALFKQVLNETISSKVKIVEICNVRKKIRSGETTIFGKDTLLNLLELSRWRRLHYKLFLI